MLNRLNFFTAICLFLLITHSNVYGCVGGGTARQEDLGRLLLKGNYNSISCAYLGEPYSYDNLQAHPGIDYPAASGKDVYAPIAGTPLLSSSDNLDNVIYFDLGNNKKLFIHHVKNVVTDTPVSKGDKIGEIFNNHVHAELRVSYPGTSLLGGTSCGGTCTASQVAEHTGDPSEVVTGINVEYFWRRDDPIIASNQNGDDNFDGQFKLKNNDSSPVTIDNMAINILKDGEQLFSCWVTDSPTTIQPGDTYDSGTQYCEILDSGSYSAEVRLQINGNWATHGTPEYFTVDDQPSGITVYDFWRKADPIYASNQSGKDNFDAQFKVQNNEPTSVTINNIAISVLQDGAWLFDCYLKNSPTMIPGNGTYSPDIKYCEIWNSGNYSVEARLQIDEEWGTYGSLSFTVYDQQTSFPDLVVESPSVDGNTLNPKEGFKILATVRNAGNGPSEETTLRYYLSSNSTISPSNSELGTDPVDALSAGASSPEDKSGCEAPSSPGTYWVGACVDAVKGESNTGNNCSVGVQITVADETPVSQKSVDYFDTALTSSKLKALPPGLRSGPNF